MFETPATPSITSTSPGQSQVVRLELGHLVDVPAGGVVDVLALDDVAHRERRPHDAGTGQGRLEKRSGDDAGDPQLVHDVGEDTARLPERPVSVDDSFGRTRHLHQADALARDLPGQFLIGHGPLLG